MGLIGRTIVVSRVYFFSLSSRFLSLSLCAGSALAVRDGGEVASVDDVRVVSILDHACAPTHESNAFAYSGALQAR
jgi:hypothetical protein